MFGLSHCIEMAIEIQCAPLLRQSCVLVTKNARLGRAPRYPSAKSISTVATWSSTQSRLPMVSGQARGGNAAWAWSHSAPPPVIESCCWRPTLKYVRLACRAYGGQTGASGRGRWGRRDSLCSDVRRTLVSSSASKNSCAFAVAVGEQAVRRPLEALNGRVEGGCVDQERGGRRWLHRRWWRWWPCARGRCCCCWHGWR